MQENNDPGTGQDNDIANDGINELHRRKLFALQMGGEVNIERHHKQGKLTARERIAILADCNSFEEFGILQGEGKYSGSELVAFVPKGHVDGFCTIDGRTVIVTAGDFTVRGGSGGGLYDGLGSELRANEKALRWRVPFVRLLDAAGGSVRTFEQMGRTYLPDGSSFMGSELTLLNVAPVISVVMGSVAGLPAVQSCLSHWNVMIRGTSQLFPGGPPVVKAALGREIDKEALGGWQVHGQVSGVVDNVVDTEEEALLQTRKFLSYLPTNVDELPPLNTNLAAPPPEEALSGLRNVIPADRRHPHNAYAILAGLVDAESFFEIGTLYGRSRITGLARVDGIPVAIMLNNPEHLGGATDVAAAEKTMRLIQLSDLFHLPLISVADEPGFMVGPESERLGVERVGARLLWTVCNSRMPMITFVVGRLFGVAGQCHHRPSGMFERFAWPSARWGSMHISGGVSAAYRREIESSDNPEQARRDIEARLENIASPFLTAEATGQNIIDPIESRKYLVMFVHEARRILINQLGVGSMLYRP